ncbi:MAG: hypothetical protein JXJ04_08720 [Spirochaetales bacterium]|nr:hypothetical protein [Spirochaetales bacterium]
MTRLILLFSLILLFMPLFCMSAHLEKLETVTIEFGKAEHQVGIDKGSGEHWKPLFFDVDEEGNIHIPDFYKARIIVIDKKGGLIKSKPCPKGISPRMNYFSRTSKGMYVTYGDYSLSLIDEKGNLIWDRMLGYGAIPRFIWANNVGIFLVLPGDDERSIVFDYYSNQPIGRFGFMDKNKGIPMVMTENNGRFTFTLSRMVNIPESGYPVGAFAADRDGYLLFVDAHNKSIFKKQGDKSEYFYLFSEKGTLLNKGTISYPEKGTRGTGFWTICDKDFHIYKNYFYEDYMEIVMYGFR